MHLSRIYKKIQPKILLLIMVSMVISQACRTKHNQIANQTQHKSIYHLAIKENIESFDPVLSVDETSGIILNLLHRNLFTTDVTGNLVNDLADVTYKTIDSVYVSIKPGIYFNHNEKIELTAEDVVYSLQRLKSSGRQPWVLEKVLDIQPYNRYTVLFTIKNADENIWLRQKYLLSLPQCVIYSKVQHEKNNQFTGASTFSVTDYNSGSIRMTSTEGLELDYKVIPSDSSRWFYFQKNSLDVYEADGVFQFLKHKKDSYNEINVLQPVVLYGAVVSDEKSILHRREFRQALNYMLDRQNLTSKVLMNTYQAADYPVPDIFNGSIPEQYHFDENYKCTGFSENNNEIINIYTPSDRDRQLTAMVIKKVLRDCGFKSKIKIVDLSTLIKINNEKRTGIYLLKWVADYPHAENFIIPLFHSRNSGSGGNRSYYKNDKLDDLLDHSVVSTQNIKMIEEMIRQDAPWIFIGFSKKHFYVNKEKKIHLPMMYTGWNEEVFSGTH